MINAFHPSTPPEVQAVLNRLNSSKERVRLVYGDKTGRSCNEEFDTIGTVGNSTGAQKIPLLLATCKSLGGNAISDNQVIGIILLNRLKPKWLYKAPNFKPSSITAEGLVVTVDGEVYANCKTERKATNLAAFLRLERHKR
jgi:hypothetical protein